MTIKLRGSTDGSVSLSAPADTSPTGTDITLTLPTDAGSANQFLKNSGTAGTLDYSSMVEDSSGNVGIGTTSPASILHVNPSADCYVTLQPGSTDGNAGINIRNSAGTQKGYVMYDTDDNYLRFGTDNTERMRIKSDGTLHVIKSGTQITNAEQTVAVFQRSSATGSTSRISIVSGNAASSQIQFGDTDDEDIGIIHYDHADNSMRFSTNTSERMRIRSDGHVLIGTTTFAGTDGITLRSDGYVVTPVSYSYVLSGSTRDLSIDDDGYLGIITSVRDAKANIQNQNDVDWLYQLEPVTFNYKTRDRETGEYTGDVGSNLEYGLIAEDVETVCPDLCFYDETDDGPELRGVSYKKLITPMLKALQDAKAKIETLETKVAALEAA